MCDFYEEQAFTHIARIPKSQFHFLFFLPVLNAIIHYPCIWCIYVISMSRTNGYRQCINKYQLNTRAWSMCTPPPPFPLLSIISGLFVKLHTFPRREQTICTAKNILLSIRRKGVVCCSIIFVLFHLCLVLCLLTFIVHRCFPSPS